MDTPHAQEYDFDTLPPVLYDNEVYITGAGEATIVSAHTVYLNQGTLRVHGTGSETIVVKASGDSSVSAYGNVLVLASDQARVYSYNNSYVVASGQANVLMFDAGVLVANDAARGILHNNAQGYAHGQAMIQGFENSALTATDESILSVRDNARAELRGNSTAYVYDLSVTHGYDTAHVYVESPLVSVQLRHNAVVEVSNAEIASTLHSPDNRPDNFLVFYQPSTDEPSGMIHLADGSRLVVDESAEPAPETPESQPQEPAAADTEDVSVDGGIESLGRHGHEGGMSVADLLARNAAEEDGSSDSDDELGLFTDDEDDEDEVQPEQIRAGSSESESVSDGLSSSDPSSLLDGFESESFAATTTEEPAAEPVASESADRPVEDTAPEPVSAEPAATDEPRPAPTVSRGGFRPQKPDNSAPAGAQSTTMKRPEGDTVQEQLEGQGWAIITPPTGMMLGLEYTSDEEVASYRSSSAASSSSSDSSSSAVSDDNDVEEFDFGDDDDDDFDLTIPGYDKD